LINPLRKRRKRDGALYQRFPDIEALLHQLNLLPAPALIARCQLPKIDPGFVPSECVLHFVRREWASQNLSVCNPLLAILLERVRRRLPRAVSPDGRSVSLARSDAAEQIHDTFVGMLIGEMEAYDERLDFFEIAFGRGLAMLSHTAEGRAGRSASRRAAVLDEEEGEVEAEVEEAFGTYDPFAPEILDQSLYRSRLAGAMSRLDPLEARIVEMHRQGIPISSKDADVITMVGLTKRSDKGIRLIRDRAFAKLRRLLERGDAL
jgi:hypothetical protein